MEKTIITTETQDRFLVLDKILIDNSTHYLAKHINDRFVAIVNPQNVINYEVIK